MNDYFITIIMIMIIIIISYIQNQAWLWISKANILFTWSGSNLEYRHFLKNSGISVCM